MAKGNKRKRQGKGELAEDGDGLDGGDFSLEIGAPGLDDGDGMRGWYDSEHAAVSAVNADAAPDAPTTEKLREAAQASHDAAVAGYEAGKAGAKESSDAKWMQTVLRSGTTSDKVAAMTLLVQESPMHNLASLQKLLDLAGKRGGAREGRTMACDALKDLMLQTLLPERKLRWFAQQPLADLPADEGSPERMTQLRYWHFEDAVKRSYIDFLAILERDLGDTVSKFKLKAMHTVADLLKTKAENEKILLTLLANKIGDTDKRVGARTVHLLQTLVFEHSAMKTVVAREIENIAFRPNVGLRTQYYAVIFLSNLTLIRGTDGTLAARLIGAYFGLFEQMVRAGASSSAKTGKSGKAKDLDSDASVQSRLMSALLTGVNRAFPYARDGMDSETTDRHVEALYRLVHAKDSATGGIHINVSIQSLQLLQQLQSNDSGLSDRFYRSLYHLISLAELRPCRKQAMFLNLLYKAMLKDEDEGRLRAFVKRILQSCSYHHPPFVCGALFMLSEVAKTKPHLRQWIASAPAFEPPAPAQKDTVPDAEDGGEESETDEGTSVGKRSRDGNRKNKTAAKQRQDKAENDDIEINQRKPQAKAAATDDTSTVDPAAPQTASEAAVGKYDPSKREPLYAGAAHSLPWELVGLRVHFHPTVRTFCAELQAGKTIVYGGDPLADHSLLAFLDRFQFKKPKAPKTKREATAYSAHAARGRLAERGVQINVGKGLGVVNTEAFAKLSEAEVPPKDLFFHHFFSRTAVQRDVAQRRKLRDEKAQAKAAKEAEVKGEGTATTDGSDVRGFGEDSSDEEGLDDTLTPYNIDDMQADSDGDDDEFGFGDDDSDDVSDDDDVGGGGGGGGSTFADADDFAALIANPDDVQSSKGSKKQAAWESRNDDNMINRSGSSKSRPGRKGAGSRAKSKGRR